MTATEVTALMAELDSAFRRRKELEFQIERGKRDLMRSEKELAERTRARCAKEEETRVAKSRVADQELEAARVAQSLNRRREQLNAASSEREYSAIKLQIELDEKKNDALADATLETLTLIDQLERDLKEISAAERTYEEQLTKKRAEFATLEPELRGKIQDANLTIGEIEARFPREFQLVYAEAVTRWGREDARSPLDGEYCGRCHQGAPIDLVLRVRAGVPALCYSCGRLLYAPEFQ